MLPWRRAGEDAHADPGIDAYCDADPDTANGDVHGDADLADPISCIRDLDENVDRDANEDSNANADSADAHLDRNAALNRRFEGK